MNTLHTPLNKAIHCFLLELFSKHHSGKYLYQKYPQFDEGILTNIRSLLVNTKSLASIAKDIGLGNLLKLSKGEEESKGTPAVKAAYELLKECPVLNFAGNIEGNALFRETSTDVIVCDGFVGNVILKVGEAFYHLYKSRNLKDAYFDRLDWENIGGTPIVGINANVVIGHGISKRRAIMNMVLQTRGVVHANLAQKIKEAI